MLITVTDRQGHESVIEAGNGLSLMESLRAGGQDDLVALCGGCCACATCHVYIDPEFADRMPVIGEDESTLLETSEHRNAQSRLACQIIIGDALSGLRVTIAPED